jgi:pimeloyl-ACP methyl ester carboxylesterase
MPIGLWFVRTAIRALALLSPKLAGRWVYSLWFQPQRFPEPKQEQVWRASATPVAILHRGQPLAAESWGAGPTVLLVHGWNGRGAQLGAFAPALVKAGYRVVTFDTPAHGRSPGNATNLPEISEAIQEIAQACGPVHAVIGHSFGVACTLFAVQQGLQLNRIAAISPPHNVRGLTQKFFTALDIGTPWRRPGRGRSLFAPRALAIAASCATRKSSRASRRLSRPDPWLYGNAVIRALRVAVVYACCWHEQTQSRVALWPVAGGMPLGVGSRCRCTTFRFRPETTLPRTGPCRPRPRRG